MGVAPPRRLYVPERVSVCFAAARAAYNEEVMDGSTYHSAEEASRRTENAAVIQPRTKSAPRLAIVLASKNGLFSSPSGKDILHSLTYVCCLRYIFDVLASSVQFATIM